MPTSHSSEAVVLRWRSYGESDKIVTFLTRDFGKITGIGKGAKNSRRRFPNSLESMARVRVHFRQKAEASLAFLESCELLSASTTPMDPERLAYGAYLTELAEQFTVEWSPAEETFSLLDEALQVLERSPATASFLRAYELKLLQYAGFGSPLERCVQCGNDLNENEICYFGTMTATFQCQQCGVGNDTHTPIAATLLAMLRGLRLMPLTQCQEQPLTNVRDEAARLTGQMLSLHLIRPLRSLRTIDQLTRSQ